MVISRVEGWEERESKEDKEQGRKTKTNPHTQAKNYRAKEINRERYSTSQR
jgi:hypothetical protein